MLPTAETMDIRDRIYELVLRFDCTLSELAESTGLSLGFLKHLLYDENAPRYDHVLRLLASAYLPEVILQEKKRLGVDFMPELISACTAQIAQTVSCRVTVRKNLYFTNKRQIKRIANGRGKSLSLDSIVRLLLDRIIRPADLVPPFHTVDNEGNPVSPLPDGLTDENTHSFFQALKELFYLGNST